MPQGFSKAEKIKLIVTPGSTPAVIAGLLTGPLVWLSALQLNFAIVPFACWYQWRVALHAVAIVSLLLIAGSGVLSWLSWRYTGLGAPTEGYSSLERNRFLSVLGVATSAFAGLALLGQEIANWMLDPCQ
jgi:hypothetical protein